MKNVSLFVFSLLSVAAFSGCNESKAVPECPTPTCVIEPNTAAPRIDIDLSTRKMALVQANSCDDYRKHLLDDLAIRVANDRFGGYRRCGMSSEDLKWDFPVFADADMVNEAAEPASETPKGESAGEFTTTNVQEAGVDELDTVKNDANYMYAIRGNQIHISKIWPVEDMKEVAVIERDELQSDDGQQYIWFNSYGIFLTDDKKLIDIGQVETWNYDDHYWYGSYSGVISVRVFDVSTPESPKLLSDHQLDGTFVDARLIDNRLHLVTSASPHATWQQAYELSREDIPGVPYFFNPCNDEDFDPTDWSTKQWDNWYSLQDDWVSKADQNIDEYLPVIRAWLDKKYPTLEHYNWPQYFDGTSAKPAIACENIYIPAMASQKEGFLIVSEFSGDKYDKYTSTAIADSGWLVYASQKNMYVSSFSDNWWWDCENTEDGCRSYTHIHHFNLGDQSGQVKYINSGEIDGRADNAFFYSEYDNHLRVFSSLSNWGNSPEGQKLTVLDITTPAIMKETGSYKGFGKDEMIYSARMVGDKGYIVTFRNTDPLFVVDLSNHNAPKLAGELKINGYSSYIHPVGKDHLLTVGMDGDDFGIINGVKLDLYDVSNPADPQLKYQAKINETKGQNDDDYDSSDSWSEALSNHHAFQYHEASGLLAIPANVYNWHFSNDDYNWNYHEFSGIFVYRVKPDKDFEFVGGIDHSDLIPKDGYYHWWTSVERSRFYFKDAGVYDKNAYIYTLSHHGLKASNANDPSETFGKIQYTQDDNGGYWGD